MHPHWYSASPDTQRKLISLFILSLSPTSPTRTPGSTESPFESELRYTRSPYDVASLLRWGLRHYQPSPDALNFGLKPDWYQVFTADPARREGYPDVGRALAVEPMTCPPDALRSGRHLIRLEGGDQETFSFGLAVTMKG